MALFLGKAGEPHTLGCLGDQTPSKHVFSLSLREIHTDCRAAHVFDFHHPCFEFVSLLAIWSKVESKSLIRLVSREKFDLSACPLDVMKGHIVCAGIVNR